MKQMPELELLPSIVRHLGITRVAQALCVSRQAAYQWFVKGLPEDKMRVMADTISRMKTGDGAEQIRLSRALFLESLQRKLERRKLRYASRSIADNISEEEFETRRARPQTVGTRRMKVRQNEGA